MVTRPARSLRGGRRPAHDLGGVSRSAPVPADRHRRAAGATLQRRLRCERTVEERGHRGHRRQMAGPLPGDGLGPGHGRRLRVRWGAGLRRRPRWSYPSPPIPWPSPPTAPRHQLHVALRQTPPTHLTWKGRPGGRASGSGLYTPVNAYFPYADAVTSVAAARPDLVASTATSSTSRCPPARLLRHGARHDVLATHHAVGTGPSGPHPQGAVGGAARRPRHVPPETSGVGGRAPTTWRPVASSCPRRGATPCRRTWSAISPTRTTRPRPSGASACTSLVRPRRRLLRRAGGPQVQQG